MVERVNIRESVQELVLLKPIGLDSWLVDYNQGQSFFVFWELM
jgi:hypothetical protein